MDMCHGPLFSKVVRFSVPLMLTGMLQLLFNAVDLVVIGQYAPGAAMAAVGSTTALNSLVLNVFIGISVGANVVAARSFGAGDRKSMTRIVHTAMLTAVSGGLVLTAVGILIAEPALRLMGTPPEVLPLAALYIRICFGAIPFIMIYNFGCALLRAVGDTQRPLCYLIIAGVVNVLLNLFLVIVCHLDVEGVAVATAVSHGIAALFILTALLRNRNACRLKLRLLTAAFDGGTFQSMLVIGIPAGLQSSCFSISNMTIQSTINSFGWTAMAGSAAAVGLEGIAYTGSYAYHQTAISFVAQNMGGGKYKRIIRSLVWCFIGGAVCCGGVGALIALNGRFLLSLFSPDPDIIAWGMVRLRIVCGTYFLCGFMDAASGGLRGLGYSTLSTLNSLAGACGIRILWIATVVRCHHTFETLLISYPVSWTVTTVAATVMLTVILRRMIRIRIQRRSEWQGLKPGFPRGVRFLGIK